MINILFLFMTNIINIFHKGDSEAWYLVNNTADVHNEYIPMSLHKPNSCMCSQYVEIHIYKILKKCILCYIKKYNIII